MATKTINLDRCLSAGLSILGSLDSIRVTREQVARISSLYCGGTGESVAFRHPDYTIHVYTGGSDGWECFRLPNGAGILTRISHAKVLANASARERKERAEELAGEANKAFDAALDAGRDPRTDEAFAKAQAEYRSFLSEANHAAGTHPPDPW